MSPPCVRRFAVPMDVRRANTAKNSSVNAVFSTTIKILSKQKRISHPKSDTTEYKTFVCNFIDRIEIGRYAVNIRHGAEDSFISSTYWTESVGPVAALATIKKMEETRVWEHAKKWGRF